MGFKDFINPPLPRLDDAVAEAATRPQDCSTEDLERALLHWHGKEMRWLRNEKEAIAYNIIEVWDEISRLKDIIKRRRAVTC